MRTLAKYDPQNAHKIIPTDFPGAMLVRLQALARWPSETNKQKIKRSNNFVTLVFQGANLFTQRADWNTS
jgi:hypothetical protein